MSITHAKTSGLPADEGDASKVNPSDWYADHVEDPILGQFGAADTAFEFDTNSLTGLTTFGAADGRDANTQIASHLWLKDDDAEMVGVYASFAGGKTAIAKLSDARAIGNYPWVGMWAGIATPGKLTGMAIMGENANIRWFHATGPTDTGFSSTIPSTGPMSPTTIFPAYFAIRAASDTDVSLYWSRGNGIWYPILLNDNNSMTIGSVALYVGGYAGGNPAVAAWDYLRIYNSVKTFPTLI